MAGWPGRLCLETENAPLPPTIKASYCLILANVGGLSSKSWGSYLPDIQSGAVGKGLTFFLPGLVVLVSGLEEEDLNIH